MEGEALQSSSFNCNICLNSVSEPVVTMCGHLYCCHCIHEWLHHHDHILTGPTCPTCKSPLSNTSLIPLYGQDCSKPSKTGSTPNRPSLVHCTRSREVQDHHHPGTSDYNNSNYNTWIDDGHFRSYCGLAGFAVGVKYECQYRCLDERGAMWGIWIGFWLRMLLSALLVFVVHCIIWF